MFRKCPIISTKYRNSSAFFKFLIEELVGSISIAVQDLPSDRKVSFDWGLQMNYDMPYNLSSFYMAPIWVSNKSRSLTWSSRAVHEHDFSAKELYDGLENMLEGYGYDRSCLKRSICELSQYPFDEDYANVVTDVITFFLTPSIHQGFTADEKYEESLYRLAEDQGLTGQNCQKLYQKCRNGLFNILTVINFMKA